MICRLYGFLRIMRYSCLLLLSILKFSVWRLFRRLVYSVYTQMRIRLPLLLCFICLLTCSLVFGISDAYAQDPTSTDTPAATATPTNSSIYSTPTVAPTGNYQCNGEQPIGWMTVTPDAYWLMQCGFCVTPVSSTNWFGENPFNITGTPVFGDTPTPVSTATITPTPDNLNFTDNVTSVINYATAIDPALPAVDYYGEYLDKLYYDASNGKISFWTPDIGTSVFYEVSFKIATSGILPARSGFGDRHVQLKITNDSLSLLEVDLDLDGIYEIQLTSGQSYIDIFYECNHTIICNYQYTYLINAIGHGASSTYRDFSAQVSVENNFASHKYVYYNIEWWRGLFYFIPPTPTPTTVPITDCSEVDPAEDGSTGGMGNEFTLPNISLGWGRCMSLGGWNISLTWAQAFIPTLPDSWTVPGIEICFVPIEFGELNLFGLGVDLDLIAAVMAGVLIIRIIRQ